MNTQQTNVDPAPSFIPLDGGKATLLTGDKQYAAINKDPAKEPMDKNWSGYVRVGTLPPEGQAPQPEECSILLGSDDGSTLTFAGKTIKIPDQPGKEGGNSYQEKTDSVTLMPGWYKVTLEYHNIAYSKPDKNVAILNASIGSSLSLYDVVPDKKKPEKKPCEGDGKSGGGAPPPSRSRTLRAFSNGIETSSGGSMVTAGSDQDGMLWRCNFGVFRGMTGMPSGFLEMIPEQFSSDLWTPKALCYRQGMASKLVVPSGGIQANKFIQILNGADYSNYFIDGDNAHPSTVGTTARLNEQLRLLDSSMNPAMNTPAYLQLSYDNKTSVIYDLSTGDPVFFRLSDGRMISKAEFSSCLDIVHAEDGAIRQIWNFWDGLASIENITATGYTIALYLPSQVGEKNAQTGLYAVTGNPFKTFVIAGDPETNRLSITEQAVGRSPFVTTWWESEGAWNMSQGTGDEEIFTIREKTVLSDEQWQLVTTVKRGNTGAPASCVCELYQMTGQGNLCVSRTEGHGTALARTTLYEYDSSGRRTSETRPDGGVVRYAYDEKGRLAVTHEPWAGGASRSTYVFYRDDDVYSSDIDHTRTDLIKNNGVPVHLSKTAYTYSESGHVRRVEKRTIGLGSSVTQYSVEETNLGTYPNPYARGRVHFRQDVNGVGRLYDYEAASSYGALYKVTETICAQSEEVSGKSTRKVSYVSMEGNEVRTEHQIFVGEEWVTVETEDYEFGIGNNWIKRTRSNGRVTERAMSCTGLLWEINEDGIRTDYSYNTARELVETIRSSTAATPEIITSYTRDAAGRVLQTRKDIGPMTVVEDTSYDILGRVISHTDTLGRKTTTSYSEDGLTVTQTMPTGATLVTLYHPDGSILRACGTAQRDISYVTDTVSDGVRVTRTTPAEEETVILGRDITDGFGNLIRTATPNTQGSFIEERMSYNALGQLTKRQIDGMAPLLFEYDAFGVQSKQTLQLAATPTVLNSRITETAWHHEIIGNQVYRTSTVTVYNEEGSSLVQKTSELVSMLDGSLESKTIQTDVRGNETIRWTEYTGPTRRTVKIQIPTSSIIAEQVVTDGYRVAQKNHAGITTTQSRTYTVTGTTEVFTDARGNTTTILRDIAGREASRTDAAGNTTTTSYDPVTAQVSCVTNALGKTSCYAYDIRGRKSAEWGTAIQPASFGYDEADHLVSLTTFRVDGETVTTAPRERTDGDTTLWIYDPATGLLLSKIYADKSGDDYMYDAWNRKETWLHARAIDSSGTRLSTFYAYDEQTGELTSVTHNDGQTPSVSYERNHLGLLMQITDDSGTRTISYNAYNEQESETTAGLAASTLHDSRDILGRPSGYSLEYGASIVQQTAWEYDTQGRLASVSLNALTHPFTYGYNENTGLPDTLSYPNAMQRRYTWETHRDLLTKVAYWRNGSTNDPAKVEYIYDNLGRPTTRKDYFNAPAPDLTHAYGYNDRNELVSDIMSRGGTYSYDYDNIGNRKTSQEASGRETDYTSNQLNQYTTIAEETQTPFAPEYDADGNQTRIRTSTGEWVVSYNAFNQAVSFIQDDKRIECRYDYLNRRVEKAVYVGETLISKKRFIYRNYVQIAELDVTASTETPVLRKTYLWDPLEPTATRILAMTTFDETGAYQEDLYYMHDALKNVIALFGIQAGRRALYEYGPYGNMVKMEGNAAEDNPFRFSSEYSDDELKMVYYNYRYYNTLDGRWITRDPEEENNLYSYIRNSPSIYYDSLGLVLQDFNTERDIEYQDLRAFGVESRTPQGRTVMGVTKMNWPKGETFVRCYNCRLILIMDPKGAPNIQVTYYAVPRGTKLTDRKGRNVVQHEQFHITSYTAYWDAFVSKANTMEKSYDTKRECAAALKKILDFYDSVKTLAQRKQDQEDQQSY